MKKAKKLFKWIVASVVLAVGTMPCWADTATINGVMWIYTVSGETAMVTGGGPDSGSLDIPSTLGGYPVTDIGENAFLERRGVTAVSIPNSVTNIGVGAFWYCTGLVSLVIPDSVRYIDQRAFRDCSGLTTLTMGRNVETINFAFQRCNNLKAVHISDLEAWCRITFVDNPLTFAKHLYLNGNEITNLVFPENTTVIGGFSFNSCEGLKTVTIPDSVTQIGGSAFSYCTALASVKMGKGMTDIGECAFMGCDRLTALEIPPSVTNIGYYAFQGCIRLPEISLPESLKSIGHDAFNFCASLSTLVIPASVESIEWDAFADSGLKTLWVPESWKGTSMLENAGVPSGCTVEYVAYQLSLGASNRTFTAAAASGKELKVSANIPWKAKSNVSWLTLERDNGTGDGSIVYNVAANTEAVARTGIIVVTGGGLTQMFTVTQNGKTVTLELGASERSFTADAASGKLLAVTADVSWTAKSSASWLTVKTASGSGSGNIECALAANTGTARTGTITVSGGGLTRTFTVSQSGKSVTLILAASEQSFTADAANGQVLGVTADVSWTAHSSVSWLTIKTGSGRGNGEIVYNVEENTRAAERTGTLMVSGGDQTRMFTVTQSGTSAILELGTNARTFSPDAASGMELAVTANVSWTAISSTSWLTVKTPNGTGNGVVVYDVAANPGTGERMGAITVSGGA